MLITAVTRVSRHGISCAAAFKSLAHLLDAALLCIYCCARALLHCYLCCNGPEKMDLAANMDDWKERVKKAMAGETAAKEEPEDAEDGPIADCFMVVQ